MKESLALQPLKGDATEGQVVLEVCVMVCFSRLSSINNVDVLYTHFSACKTLTRE